METDRPGREIDQEYREVITHLIDNEGWCYRKPRGGGYPQLFPAKREYPPIRVPKTGHTRGRRFSNWLADVRRKGGHWPPQKR